MGYADYAPLSSIGGWILVILRVLMGAIFIYFGWPKLRNLSQNAGNFERMGFKPGILFGTGIAILEVFGGAFLIVGLFVGVVAALLGVHMLVGTIWKITSTDKKFSDWSYDLLLLGFALALLAFGPGEYFLFTIV